MYNTRRLHCWNLFCLRVRQFIFSEVIYFLQIFKPSFLKFLVDVNKFYKTFKFFFKEDTIIHVDTDVRNDQNFALTYFYRNPFSNQTSSDLVLNFSIQIAVSKTKDPHSKLTHEKFISGGKNRKSIVPNSFLTIYFTCTDIMFDIP